MLSVRPAVEADFAFMQKTHHESMHDVVVATWGAWDAELQAKMAREQFDSDPLDILLRHAERVGYQIVVDHPDCVSVNMIAIAPAFQGQGLGTAAMKAIQVRAREAQLPVYLTVLCKNPRAFAFYERLGFVKTGNIEHHHEMMWHPHE